MATYYWVGGNGAWNTSDARNWSSTSGGAGGTPDSANVSSISWSLLGQVGTSSTSPTSGTNDDGFWTFALPFSITYLGRSYSNVFVGTNGYITFDAGYTRYSPGVYTSIGVNTFLPAVPKIYLGVQDNSCQRVYSQSSGVTPNRTFWVRYEGTRGTSGTLGSPTRVYEATFYEATPNQIDIAYGIFTSTAGYIGVYNPETQLATLSLTANTAQRITTSGSGGVGVPTSADDVIFDANSNVSAYTVTVSALQNCRDLTISSGPSGGGNVVFSGLPGDPTLTNITTAANTPNGLYIYGNVNMTSANGATGTFPVFRFSGNTGSFTINSGNSQAVTYGIVNGVNSTWTLANTFSANTSFAILNGNVNTTSSDLFLGNINATASAPYWWMLGSGNISVALSASPWNINSGNHNILANTSTLNFTLQGAAGSIFPTASRTFNKVVANINPTLTSTQTVSITGSGTFANLTLFLVNSAYPANVSIPSSTIGNIVLSAPGLGRRIYFRSDLTGTARTITTSGTAVLENVDFRDINVSGPTWSGTLLGNVDNNTNITFDAPKTVYWSAYSSGSSNNQWNSNLWALSSNGTPSTSNYPLVQDTVIFDNAGYVPSGSVNFTGGQDVKIGSIDATGRTTALTIGTGSPFIYGNVDLGNSVTLSTANVFFDDAGPQSFSSNGTISSPLTVLNLANAPWELRSNINTSAGFLTVNNANINLNGYTLRSTTFLSPNTTTRYLNFGNTGQIVLTGTGTVWSAGANQLLTGSKVVRLFNTSATARTVATSGASNPNDISLYANAGTGSLTTTGTANFDEFDLTGFAGTLSNDARVISGNIIMPAAATLTAGTAITVLGPPSGRTVNIESRGRFLDFPVTINSSGGTVNLANTLTLGPARTLTVTSGTFDANGYNITTGLFSGTGTTTRTINLGNSLVTLTGTGTLWDFTTVTSLSFSGANSTIRLSSTAATARTFATGGRTYGNLIIGGATGVSNLTFTGSGTFASISSEKTVNYGVIFTAGTITTVGSWTANGANARSNTRIRITSTSTSPFTLIKSGGGNVTVANANISYSNAWPVSTWTALDSTNFANNTNWTFTTSSQGGGNVIVSGNFFLVF